MSRKHHGDCELGLPSRALEPGLPGPILSSPLKNMSETGEMPSTPSVLAWKQKQALAVVSG